MATAAAAHLPTSNNVCFAELIVRLDSLLTLRPEEARAEEEGDEENDNQAQVQLENDINLKLTELHLRLKNGGSIHDRGLAANAGASAAVVDEEDEEDEAVEDSQGPSSATEGTTGSVDCIGCSSAEDENEVCPSPIQAKVKQKKTFEALFHELWTKIGAWEYGAYPPTPTPEQEEIDLDVCTDHNVGQTDIDSITPVSKRKRIYTEKEYDDKCQENASLRDDLASAQKRLKVLEHAAVRPKPRKKRTAQLEE